jgi:hypothetical protein
MGANTIVYVKVQVISTEVVEISALTLAEAMVEARYIGLDPIDAAYCEDDLVGEDEDNG